MEFEEWWEKYSDKYRKDYVMLGAFAFKTVASEAWETSKKEASKPAVEADAKNCECTLEKCCPRCEAHKKECGL